MKVFDVRSMASKVRQETIFDRIDELASPSVSSPSCSPASWVAGVDGQRSP